MTLSYIFRHFKFISFLLDFLSENGDHSEDTNMDEKKEMLADELYEVVLQQSGEIREEREMYRELLEEHDELLAVLAQKDLGMSSC